MWIQFEVVDYSMKIIVHELLEVVASMWILFFLNRWNDKQLKIHTQNEKIEVQTLIITSNQNFNISITC
jgi:hypothetical protein